MDHFEQIGGSLSRRFFIAGVFYADAQTTEALVPHIPTSPQAAAFQRYGDYAVNYSTGVPDISIPLFEIDHYGYKIPVSLKYSPQPLKPGYNYDVVGQGWALSVNGCISRSIEYEPDEMTDFVLEAPGSDYVKLCGNSCLLYKNYAHDKFSAVLPDGTSFEFIIDKQNGVRNFIVSDGRSLKMDCGASSSQIDWFTIIDEDGVKYTFDGADTPYQGPNNIYSSHYVSWQLSRIDLPYSSEPILFTNGYLIESPYNSACPEPVVKFANAFYSDYLNQGKPTPHEYSSSKTMEYTAYSYKMRLLSEISYGPQGKSKLRLLYKNASGSAYNYVDKIQLLEDNSVVKEVKLNLTVYNLSGQCSTSLAKLDSLSITGSDPQAAPMIYRFIYTSSPSAFSGTDHWGYRSNAGSYAMPNFTFFSEWDLGTGSYASNAGMMPVTKTSADVSPFYKFSLSDYPYSDTRTSEEPASHGVLQKIIYPTGGYTLFEFENHRFFSHSDFDGNYIYDKASRVIRQGGGFRIKTIENYSETGVRTDKKSFRYGKTFSQIPGSYGSYNTPNVHTGAGEPVVDPNILTYMNYSSYEVDFPIRNMILGLDASGLKQSFTDPFTSSAMQGYDWQWNCTFSALNFRRLLNGRQAVLYDQVTVYEGDVDEYSNIFPLGKTVYTYNLTGSNMDDETFEQPLYFGNMLGYIPKSYRYNKLISKTDYRFDSSSGSFKKVRKETNTWNWIPATSFDYQYNNPYPVGYQPDWITVPQVFTGKPFYIGYGRLQSKATVEYVSPTDSITVSESNSYNGRGQLIEKETMGSDGLTLRTSYEYPQAVAGGTTPAVIQSMLDRNLISPVIKSSVSSASLYSEFQELAGTNTDYVLYGSNQLLPGREYALEIKPAGSDYALRSEIKSYSANGNPLEVVSENELHTSYIWGYGDRYMIAEAKNAFLVNVAYTGFETNETGGWTYTGTAGTMHSHTGNQGYLLSGSNVLSKTGLDPSVPYQARICVYGSASPSFTGGTEISHNSEAIGQGWTRYLYIFQGATSLTIAPPISGSIWTDDACLYPADAQMTTYTYKPLVGLTSMTDAKGMTTYYEYDPFQRLQAVKDQDDNIIKSYDYHYKP